MEGAQSTNKGFPVRAASALAAAVLLAASAALADPAPGTIMKVAPPTAQPLPQQICAMQIERNMQMLGQLEKTLVLTEKQKPLFDAWMKVRVEVMKAWPCPAPSTGLDVPTPTRLEREQALLTMELDALHRERPLVGAFYDALTPEQRKTFDGPAPRPAPQPMPAAEKAPPKAPPAH
jgi:hypothetical protein